MTPASATEKPMTTMGALKPGHWLIASPTAAASAAITACRLCCPVLSAFQPTTHPDIQAVAGDIDQKNTQIPESAREGLRTHRRMPVSEWPTALAFLSR